MPEDTQDVAGSVEEIVAQGDPAPEQVAEAVTIVEAGDEPAQPVALSEAQITEALGRVTLPDVSRARLMTGQYATAQALEEAIQTEIAYVTALTGAGQPMGLQRAPAPAFDLNEALDAIDQRYQLK